MTRRRLDAELVRRGMAASRTEAQRLVEEGLVEVRNNPTPKPASQVTGDVSIRVVAPLHPYVSRGGLKLEAALDLFPIDVEGRRAVDVGASTGGFTDCLLQRGATAVVAVDVGYGQIAEKLRTDGRVAVHDRTNVRAADPDELGGPFGLVVSDLSFISLCTVAAQLAALGGDGADWVLLVKPQFEVGKDDVGRGGIVRDPMLHRRAITDVVDCFAAVGVGASGVGVSPITGAKRGNTEFLLHLVRGPVTLSEDAIEAVLT